MSEVESGWFCLLLRCGGVESNSCCQVGTVPVVLVGGLAYQILSSTKILSSSFAPWLSFDLWLAMGMQLWKVEVVLSLSPASFHFLYIILLFTVKLCFFLLLLRFLWTLLFLCSFCDSSFQCFMCVLLMYVCLCFFTDILLWVRMFWPHAFSSNN